MPQSFSGVGLTVLTSCCAQVAWNNLSAGLVIIVVTGHNIPYGPQNYALVVQGSMTGQLESSYNPAYGGGTARNCTLPVTQITSAPPLLSNQSTGVFADATCL